MEIDFVTGLAFFVGYSVIISTAIMFACLCLAIAAKAVNAALFNWVNEGKNIAWMIRFNEWRKQSAESGKGEK